MGCYLEILNKKRLSYASVMPFAKSRGFEPNNTLEEATIKVLVFRGRISDCLSSYNDVFQIDVISTLV